MELILPSVTLLALPPGHAIIDPGASQDLIGLKAYEALERRLQEVGLKPIKLSERPQAASGVGGEAKPLFSSLVPIVLGKQPGVIKLTRVGSRYSPTFEYRSVGVHRIHSGYQLQYHHFLQVWFAVTNESAAHWTQIH